MKVPKINKQEWPVMDALWSGRIMSIAEITAWIWERGSRPAYATVQTMVYRLEARGAVQRVDKIRTFHLFEAAVSRERAEGQLVADTIDSLGGDIWPILEYCIDTGSLTIEDVKAAEGTLQDLARYAVAGTAGSSDAPRAKAADALIFPKPPRPRYAPPTYRPCGPRDWMG